MDYMVTRRLYEKYDPMSDHVWIILERLTDVILTYVPGCIVEIGIGMSSLILAEHAEKMNVKFYTCDSRSRKCEWLKQRVSNPIIFYGPSYKFMEQFDDIPSVVLLDGCHRYDTVCKEFDYFYEIINIGGVIFMHDTYPWEKTYIRKQGTRGKPRLQELRKILEKREDLEVFTWPYTASYCGLTMVLKKDMSQPIYRR